VEYICLKMQANPGMPGRFYRKALYMYKHPLSKWKHPSDSFNAYFWPPHRWNGVRQVGRYYFDTAPRDRKCGGLGTATNSMVPKRSSWELTDEGWDVANRARTKLGLKPLAKPAVH
jgi:hypothetical protein